MFKYLLTLIMVFNSAVCFADSMSLARSLGETQLWTSSSSEQSFAYELFDIFEKSGTEVKIINGTKVIDTPIAYAWADPNKWEVRLRFDAPKEIDYITFYTDTDHDSFANIQGKVAVDIFQMMKNLKMNYHATKPDVEYVSTNSKRIQCRLMQKEGVCNLFLLKAH